MAKAINKSEKIRALLKQGLSVAQVAKKTGVKPAFVYTIRWKMGQKKAKKVKVAKKAKFGKALDKVEQTPLGQEIITDHINAMLEKNEARDEIAHPQHYTVGGIESWDYIEAKGLDYNLGTAVAYISRAQYKGSYLKDLRKAAAHLDRAIRLGEAVKG
jgi:transposase-like protein